MISKNVMRRHNRWVLNGTIDPVHLCFPYSDSLKVSSSQQSGMSVALQSKEPLQSRGYAKGWAVFLIVRPRRIGFLLHSYIKPSILSLPSTPATFLMAFGTWFGWMMRWHSHGDDTLFVWRNRVWAFYCVVFVNACFISVKIWESTRSKHAVLWVRT